MTQLAAFQDRARTLGELLATAEASPHYLIEDILTPGLLLLVASPKAGKTRLMLQVSEAVALGEPALGRFSVQQSPVLYYALEDGRHRIARTARSLGLKPNAELYILETLPALDRKGCEQLQSDLDHLPHARLVVIDILNRVMPKPEGGRSAYHDEAAALMPLQQMAAERDVAIVVVHHTNKLSDPKSPLQSINGTQALAGTADNLWFINRSGASGEAELYVTGRDLMEQSIPLYFSAKEGRWVAESPVDEGLLAPLVLSTRARIEQMVRDVVLAGRVSRKQVLQRLEAGLGNSTTANYLEKEADRILKNLEASGQITKHKVDRESWYSPVRAA